MAEDQRARIIRGGRVLEPRAHRAPEADILIEGDTIARIGPPGMAAPEDAVAIDARRRLLHPGLVNAHMHGHGSLAKGMGDRWTLELLLTAAPWLNGGRSDQERALSTRIGAVEMVLKGCTAAYDLYIDLPLPSGEGLAAVAAAYREVGMRAVVAPMVADLSLFEAIPGLAESLSPGLGRDVERDRMAPGQTTLEAIAAGLEGARLHGAEIRAAVAPTIPLHCSDDFFVRCARLAEEFGVGLHSHVSESKVQALSALKRYDGSIIAHLDGLGVLGPGFVAAHGVWLDGDDMARLADHGASVAHNPGSNMRLGSGLADARAMLDSGLNLGIGTDGAQCSDNLNMYEAMRIASLVSKSRGPEYGRWLSTEEVFAAATEGSARALGFGDAIGRLEAGYKADIVFLDLGHINWVPMNDPTNQIVHTEDGGAVASVMIGGRMIVDERRLTTVDIDALGREAEAARARLEAANADHRAMFERLEGAVGAYCTGLARQPHHLHRYGAPAEDGAPLP